MLVALLLMALLSIVGASTLRVAGIDNRIALQNRKHMMVLNTSHAGTEHAREKIQDEDPVDENTDTNPDTFADFVKATEAEAEFEGLAYTHNLGVYWCLRCITVVVIRLRAILPSWDKTNITPITGRWSPHGQQEEGTYSNINETLAMTSMMVRHVELVRVR